MRAFSGKVVLVAGASSGLGAALALELSRHGASVVLFARREDRLREVGSRCTGPYRVVVGDITVENDCARAVSAAIQEFGGLDVLLLSAGVSMWEEFKQVSDFKALKLLMETNFWGPVAMIRAALPELRSRHGMIVAISSIQGKIGVPYHTGYSASKHALQGFLEALRLEENLPILIVSPSWIAGTELKEKALLSNGRRKHGNRGLSLRECVTRILSAMESRKRDLFLPRSYRMLLWLQLLSPRFLGTVIQKAVRK